jgi:CBS domain-containing protein
MKVHTGPGVRGAGENSSPDLGFPIVGRGGDPYIALSSVGVVREPMGSGSTISRLAERTFLMGLRQAILADPIKDLDLRELVQAKPDEPVRQVIARMRERKLGCAVILDAAGKPVGKFTERTLIKLLRKNPAGLDEPIQRHMLTNPDTMRMTDTIGEAIDLMQSKSIRFVIVLDEQGKAVALTGQKGVMEYIAEFFPRQVKVQEMDAKLSMQKREGA